MELQGKIINFLGDSITEGVGVSDLNNLYWRQIGEQSGAVCNGYGIGGTRFARMTCPSPDPYDATDQHFDTRVEGMDKNADVVVVFGGTNDFGTGDAPLGEADSRDEYTFYGGLNLLCDHLREAFPTARIVFMTPLHRTGEHNLRNKWGVRNVCPLEGYVEIIRQVCRKNAFPVIDCYARSGLDPNAESCRVRYVPDGLHPNDAGHTKLAEFVLAQLKTL